MKMTNEQIQAILDGAPEGWTHYCTRNRKHFRRDGNSDMLFVWIVGTESWSVPLDNRTRWLERRERLEETLELRQEVERLKASIESAVGNMEYAAFNLLGETELRPKCGERIIESTCPEKSLLIAIRDLKEARDKDHE